MMKLHSNHARVNYYVTVFSSIIGLTLWLGGNFSSFAQAVNGTTNSTTNNATTPPPPDPTPSLVAHYPLDFNFNDIGPQANHGTGQGDIDFTQLSSGNGFAKFDGIDDYIQVPQSASLNKLDAMTISYWVKPDPAGKRYTIVNKGTPVTREYYSEIVNESTGFKIIPSNGLAAQPAELIAPSNFVAQYGGLSSGTPQKHVVYLTWDHNSPNQGLIIDITNQTSSCSICSNTVPANTKSFKAFINQGTGDFHNIRMYTLGSNGAQSARVYASVRVNGDANTPAVFSPSSWIPRDGKWHQVTQTRNSTTYKSYIDGRLVYSGSGPTRRQGTDPLLIGVTTPPTEVASIVSVSGETATITWDAVVGQRFLVQYKENNADSNWLNMDTVVADNAVVTKIDRQNIRGRRVYRILRLDDKTYKGGLADVRIYNKSLSDTEIVYVYTQFKGRFRMIENFAGAADFARLAEPKYSQALDELELLSSTYASTWNLSLPKGVPLLPSGERRSLAQIKFEGQIKFYKAQLQLLEKYGLLQGTTATTIITLYEAGPWATQRQNHVWLQDSRDGAIQAAAVQQNPEEALAAFSPNLQAAAAPPPAEGQFQAAGDGVPPGGWRFPFPTWCDWSTGHTETTITPAPPLKFLSYYDSPVNLFNLPPLKIHTKSFMDDGYVLPPNTPYPPESNCYLSGPAEYLTDEWDETNVLTELARFNVNLWSPGTEITPVQHQAILWSSPVKWEQKMYGPDGTLGYETIVERYKNERAGEAPPDYPAVYSMIGKYAWKLSNKNYFSGHRPYPADAGSVNGETTGLMEDQIPASGFRRAPAPFLNWGQPDSSGSRTIGFDFKADRILVDNANLPLFESDVALYGAHVIEGLVSGLNYRFLNGNVSGKFSPFNSKVVELDCTIQGSWGSCGIGLGVRGHGKGAVEARFQLFIPF